MVVVGVALAAALCYAAAMVLQQHTARAADPARSLRPGLLADLARRPLWLAGLAANVAGFACRFVALGAGGLVVVQPILVSSLLFALVASSRWHGDRLTAREWAGAAAIGAGLIGFIVAAGTDRGRTGAPARAWLTGGGVIAVVTFGLVAWGRSRHGETRAALLAGGGGALLA